MSQKQGRGRPRKFQTSVEIDQRADEYFQQAESKGEPFTMTGLAMALGTTTDTLLDYETGQYDGEAKDQRFSEAIKWQKQRVEHFAEKKLYTAAKIAGPIFHLKSMRWLAPQKGFFAEEDLDRKTLKILNGSGSIWVADAREEAIKAEVRRLSAKTREPNPPNIPKELQKDWP